MKRAWYTSVNRPRSRLWVMVRFRKFGLAGTGSRPA